MLSSTAWSLHPNVNVINLRVDSFFKAIFMGDSLCPELMIAD
jgi:hypothetical protein